MLIAQAKATAAAKHSITSLLDFSIIKIKFKLHKATPTLHSEQRAKEASMFMFRLHENHNSVLLGHTEILLS